MSGSNNPEILTTRHEQPPRPNQTEKQPDFALENEVHELGEAPVHAEDNFLDETINKLSNVLRSSKRKPVIMPQVRDNLAIEIEHIMEDGLGDAFRTLPPLQQQEFKLKGEQTAIQIRSLLQETKIKVKKIFELLIEWLKFLPGVNRFFLEQEAKIKADHIMALYHRKKT